MPVVGTILDIVINNPYKKGGGERCMGDIRREVMLACLDLCADIQGVSGKTLSLPKDATMDYEYLEGY